MSEIDTLKKELKEYEFNPAKSSDWLWFMEKTTALDKEYKIPKGWHWYIGFDYLRAQEKIANFSTKKTDKKIPDEHWLKIKDTFSPDGKKTISLKPRGNYEIMEEWAENIQAPKRIAQISLSKTFNEPIDFSNLIFPVDVSFEHAKFFGKADFRDTLFFKDAIFDDTKFLKDVRFDDAIFLETADFEDATFQNEYSYCKETAKFRNTVFEKIANFRNATFWGYANFKGAELKGRAFFQKAKFKWHAPRFYDATFNNEMTWAGIELPKFAEAKVDRYKKVGEEFEPDKCDECTECARCVERAECVKCAECAKCKALIKQNRRRRIEENQNSYENTSILLEKHRKYHDEHFFFRHEMYCRRWLGTPFSKTIHFLYEWMADYGYGVGWALLWWGVHIALGALALMLFTSYYWAYNLTEFQKILNCVTPVSFANANPYAFFGFDGGKLAGCYTKLGYLLPIAFGVIRIIQTVIGVALLFLLVLTLRVRFRLK